jgi:cAMP phosphodiesterase
VDDEWLIDAGTGVCDLSLPQMRRIRHVFITHSHLDHVCGLAFMVDNLFDSIDQPIQVHCTPETQKILRDHLFNWKIWPDFFVLPSAENPIIRFDPLQPADTFQVGQRCISPFEVLHTVPAVGYVVRDDDGVFAFSGDACDSPSLWEALNALPRLDTLMIEVAFPNHAKALALASKHFTPELLAAALKQLKHRPKLLLSHHKPGTEGLIQRQCEQDLAGWRCVHLARNDVIHI